MSIQKINETIKEVKALRYAERGVNTITPSLAAVKQVLDPVKDRLNDVAKDPLLSAAGKAEKEREIKEAAAAEIKKIIEKFTAERDELLAEAEKIAKAILTRPAVKPEPADVELFERKYNDLKTELTVFNNPTAAGKMLEFMNSVDHPYFAARIRDDFATVGAEIVKHIDNMRVRTVFENVKKTAATSEKAIAEQKLAEIESLRKSPAVDAMINLAVKQALGDDYLRAAGIGGARV